MAAIWMSVSLGFLRAFGFGTLRNGKAFSRSFRSCWYMKLLYVFEPMVGGKRPDLLSPTGNILIGR